MPQLYRIMRSFSVSFMVLGTLQSQALQDDCNASDVVLSESAQWEQEEGYWVGEYSLFGSDGNPSTASDWNYPYHPYKGFITGNVQGNKYRQRNVFMYPPQVAAECPFANSTGRQDGSSPVGVGECGVNGNMKVFEADQFATTCSSNPELKGNIEGPYGSLQYTYTELIGQNNSLLYQVFMTKAALNYYEAIVLGNPYSRCAETSPYNWDCGYTADRLMQSQLTTLTQLPDGTWLRTRTAQGFDAFGRVGAPTYASYYRERKVTEEVFWAEFNATMISYNILESDMCAWGNGESGGTVASGLTPGFSSCKTHLEESFALRATQSSYCASVAAGPTTTAATPTTTYSTTTTSTPSGFSDELETHDSCASLRIVASLFIFAWTCS